MKPPPRPRKLVAVMGADANDAALIGRMVEEGGYRIAHCTNLVELKSILARACMAAIIDVDSIPLDNRTIRELNSNFPTVRLLCASKERHHPHLREAICHHLFACLHKPIDPDELHYFLKCIRNELNETRGPPDGED